MIYCVVPEALAPELFDKLQAYYADDPNVTVIVDRRQSERRSAADAAEHADQRETRDRRRARVAGHFPRIDPKSTQPE
ncbi:MAG: hypothetical protein M3296_01895 [Actinomycetota bacterium]|nr:hypothetical protein [Actinomycetota bacterium]